MKNWFISGLITGIIFGAIAGFIFFGIGGFLSGLIAFFCGLVIGILFGFIIKSLGKKNIKVGKNVLLLFCSILLVFILFEIGLRVINYPNYGYLKGMFEADDIYGYKLSPDFSGTQKTFQNTFEVNTNSKGLRDFREYDYERNNKKRILILGDCFSLGNGEELENTYVELLRKNFNEEVEIINLGVLGYGINNEYLYFINEGKKYNPDIILLQFSPSDFSYYKIEENGKEVVDKNHSYTVNKDGLLISNNKPSFFKSIHFFSMVNIKSYNMLYAKLRPLVIKIDKVEGDIPIFYINEDSERYKEAYQGYSSILKKLNESTDTKIILFSGPSEIYLADPKEIKEDYKVDYTIKPNQIEKSIEKIAEDLQMDFISIKSDDPNNFLEIIGHWTPEESKKIADELYLKLNDVLKE